MRMSEELEQLRKERAELWERAKRFHAERTSAEEPVLRGEDEYRYYEIVGGIMRLGQRITELEARERLERACEDVSRFVTGAGSRVLTFEEVRKLPPNELYWIEFRGMGVYHREILTGLANEHRKGKYVYGKDWRIWDRKPEIADLERKAWQG